MLNIEVRNFKKNPKDGRYIQFDEPGDLDLYNDNYGVGNVFPFHSFITSRHSGSGLVELEFDRTADADVALEKLQSLRTTGKAK